MTSSLVHPGRDAAAVARQGHLRRDLQEAVQCAAPATCLTAHAMFSHRCGCGSNWATAKPQLKRDGTFKITRANVDGRQWVRPPPWATASLLCGTAWCAATHSNEQRATGACHDGVTTREGPRQGLSTLSSNLHSKPNTPAKGPNTATTVRERRSPNTQLHYNATNITLP